MKTRKTLKKNITSKKYKKTRYRRYNMRINLNRTMKGGMIYTEYRERQLARIREILSELGYIKQPWLKKLIEKIELRLRNHIKTVSVDGIWRNTDDLDSLMNTVNNNLTPEIKGIPIVNTIQPDNKILSYRDNTEENNPSSRKISRRQSTTATPYSRSSINKSKGRAL